MHTIATLRESVRSATVIGAAPSVFLTGIALVFLPMGANAATVQEAPTATPQSAPAAIKPGDSTTDDPATPKIIEGAISVYDYSPESKAGSSKPLREVFEELGPDAIEWYQHVITLSNPFFEGRAPGTVGAEDAADYIEWWMRRMDLEPAFPAPAPADARADASSAVASASAIPDQSTWVSFRQPFELAGAGPKVQSASVGFSGRNLERSSQFAVLGNSGSGSVTAPITFVGYAIEEGKDGYTSFEPNCDLTGRIAMFFRYEPLDDAGASQWADRRFSEFAAMSPKMDALQARGAAGVIMVTPPDARDGRKRLESTATSRFGDRMGVPVVQITTEEAEELVKACDPQHRTLLDLRKLADKGEVKSIKLADDAKVELKAELSGGMIETCNLGGVIRGKGSLAKEWVIVGGHWDHVGYGDYGADPRNRGELHPGADDNASGASAVLVLANRLGKLYRSDSAPAEARSILFLNFGAEEVGLDGSKFWVEHPTLGVDQIHAMVNMDMVGRLRDDDLAVGGVGTAEGFLDILRPAFTSSGLTIRADPSGRGPSDHQSFYNGGIPVLFIFTGVHGDYHKPTDRGYTVDPAGAAKVIALGDEIVRLLASMPDKLKFQSTDGARTAGRGGAKVRLGVMPAYGSDESGVHVEAVSAETSAAEAGIKAGDVLLGWNDAELNGPADMMEHLRGHSPGDKVKIRLRRGTDEIVLEVTLKASASKS
ncbi:MAG: M28 family peptidase [Phycisphaerales bacterium]|nr:M28 family peptidase [Phycisphaerales bacterium]